MILKLPRVVHFLKVCADLSKKANSVKAIYLYPSKRPLHTYSENNMFYRGLRNSSQDIEEENIKKVLTQQNFNKIHLLKTLIF